MKLECKGRVLKDQVLGLSPIPLWSESFVSESFVSESFVSESFVSESFIFKSLN